MRVGIAASLSLMCLLTRVDAATIYPLDRATILAGSPFDLKVEFAGQHQASDVTLTINGRPAAEILGKSPQFVAKEEGVDASAILIRAADLKQPGRYVVEAAAGDDRKTVAWDVFGTAPAPKAKTIIFLLGDGLSMGHRTGARIMSKGMTEGKANGRLATDDLEHMALIGTSATNAIATDSANTMSAYMTGHKTAVNALGVYADRTKNSLDDPKVETIAEALRRRTKKSIGIVTTSEIEDATPAAVVAHTRLRADKAEIVGMIYDLKPEVILGGGSAYFTPAKRKDGKDYTKLFQEAGYTLATDKAGLEAARGTDTGKILGLFHPGNMDVTLDREFLKKGTVPDFPAQPGLLAMTKVALEQLSKNPDGFFLMVEGASIDKMSHPMDWDRALFETIEYDQAVGLALAFAKTHPDTLVVATADHTHGMSVVGTISDEKAGAEMRDKVGTYADAGFPNYEDKDGDGFPDRVDVSRRLATFAADFPDYYETFRPKLDGPFEPVKPVEENGKKLFVANPAYKDIPGAVLRTGNLPRTADSAVHAVDDVVLQASGPGAEGFKGYMEESDVYRVLADAFALGPTGP